MKIIEFIENNKLNFTRVNISLDENNKKKFSNNRVQLTGIKTMTYEECKKQNEMITEYNQFYINLNKMKNIIVIDTDHKDSYELVKGFLKENDIYDVDYITSSFTGKKLGLKYKKHFWLRMTNAKDYDDIIFQEYKLKNDDSTETGDLRINSGVIGEFVDTEIDFDTLPTISRNEFNEMAELLNIKLKTVPKETTKPKETEKIMRKENEDIILNEIGMENKINNETLYKILDNLNIKRFDNYESWLIMAMIFVNEKLDLNIFEEYSKRSSKFDKESNNKIIGNLKKNINGYSVNTLFMWLKEDDFETFKEVNMKVTFKELYNQLNESPIAGYGDWNPIKDRLLDKSLKQLKSSFDFV